MIGISEKQGDMLAFIEKFVFKNGYPPTREEIRTGLNISTKSLVNYHLEALESAALITRIPNTPRGLKLKANNNAKKHTRRQKAANHLPTLNPDQVLELAYGAVTNENNLYALKINKDMIEDQNQEGDIVIVQQQSQVQNGEMAAVRLLDRNQTAIRRYFRENGHVRLQSINFPNKEADIVAPEMTCIEGKVIAIIREVD